MTIINTKSTYTSLKQKEEELLAQLKELKEEIAIAEKDVVTEKLNTALQCLADVDNIGYYHCYIRAYCNRCDEDVEFEVDLEEIICALQQIR